MAATSSSSCVEAVLAGTGAGVGLLTGVAISRTTLNSSGPTRNVSSCLISRSPLTGSLLIKVPLVLSKSRMKTFPPLISKAQCLLLIIGLAGRRLHCGSRPMMNCESVMGMAFPADLPAVKTIRLSFIDPSMWA